MRGGGCSQSHFILFIIVEVVSNPLPVMIESEMEVVANLAPLTTIGEQSQPIHDYICGGVDHQFQSTHTYIGEEGDSKCYSIPQIHVWG